MPFATLKRTAAGTIENFDRQQFRRWVRSGDTDAVIRNRPAIPAQCVP